MSSTPGSSLSADFSEREQQIFHRTRLLVGDQVLHRIGDLRVILFGVGGVGSWCAESLVRSGVRRLTLVDSDRVSITNVNRQMPATVPTVGRVKVEVVRERLLSINPDAEICAVQDIYCAENAETFALDTYDVIIDAIDSLAEKAHLILRATQTEALFVSSMGAALKMDPTRVQIAEFGNVRGCPLARALRNKFKRAKTWPKRKFRCVFSDEVLPNLGVDDITEPEPTVAESTDHEEGRADLLHHSWNDRKAQINGTLSHITAIFGFTLAGIVIDNIYREEVQRTEKNSN